MDIVNIKTQNIQKLWHITIAVYDVASRQPGGWQCGGVFAWERGSAATD
jgi:hypothetical protein